LVSPISRQHPAALRCQRCSCVGIVVCEQVPAVLLCVLTLLAAEPDCQMLVRCVCSLVLTRKDNVLLHLQATGSRYSLDFGASWSDLKLSSSGGVFTTQYYPRAVEAADGTIIVTSHRGSDDAYMREPPFLPPVPLRCCACFLGFRCAPTTTSCLSR
jgi:hypothetical protein